MAFLPEGLLQDEEGRSVRTAGAEGQFSGRNVDAFDGRTSFAAAFALGAEEFSHSLEHYFRIQFSDRRDQIRSALNIYGELRLAGDG